MKRQFIYMLFVLAGAVGLTSCENWLDETSHSEIRDEDHFSTEEGFRQSLIGCYINMTDESLNDRIYSDRRGAYALISIETGFMDNRT